MVKILIRVNHNIKYHNRINNQYHKINRISLDNKVANYRKYRNNNNHLKNNNNNNNKDNKMMVI
jgi:hypothetical protein